MTVRYFIDVKLESRPGLGAVSPAYAAEVIYNELRDAVADVIIERRLRTKGLRMELLEDDAPSSDGTEGHR